MKLRFLGQTYSTDNRQITTLPSKYTARFLGQTYTPHLPIKSVKSQLGLKYRGINYRSTLND